MRLLLAAALALSPAALAAQTPQAAPAPRTFTHADTLRGSNGPGRAWWDAEFYDLHVAVSPADRSIRGYNTITYRVLRPAVEMQIDLQQPLEIDSVVQNGQHLTWRRDGAAWFVSLAGARPRTGTRDALTVFYHGSFWGGPFHWAVDSAGAPWIATSDEGPGASTWWPLKDLPADEPDSQRIAITVPDPLIDISNGRLRSTTHNADGTTTYQWFVADPINSYDIAINASPDYVAVRDTFAGAEGPLTVEFWALRPHETEARKLVPQAKAMLACFEHWFGPYPWYRDGYKLIEVPYLGMEHQSGIAYGNRYLPGYIGRDLSGTGEGMSWDYIVVHESAHEWWGNSVSSKDHADMWIHESFGMYAEGLWLECQKRKEAGERYLIGARRMIRNDTPIIGAYGVNDVPRSQDRYPKGANMLMTMRAVVNDDARWLATLRGVQKTFRHQTVTAKQIQDYMSRATGVDLSKIFEQYLTTTKIPRLEYLFDGKQLSYRWTDVVPGFAMPLQVDLDAANDSSASPARWTRIEPTTAWRSMPSSRPAGSELRINPEFYATAVPASAAKPPQRTARPNPAARSLLRSPVHRLPASPNSPAQTGA